MEKIKIEIEVEMHPDIITPATWEEPAHIHSEGSIILDFFKTTNLDRDKADKLKDLIINFLEENCITHIEKK